MSRYIVFEIIGPDVCLDEAEDFINYSIFHSLGELNLALYDYRFLKERYSKNRGIIKCSTEGVNPIRAALILARKMGEKTVMVNVRGLSGTIKTASRKFMNR